MVNVSSSCNPGISRDRRAFINGGHHASAVIRAIVQRTPDAAVVIPHGGRGAVPLGPLIAAAQE